LDEQTIKVIAAFTPVGQWWPVGAWIVTDHSSPSGYYWHRIRAPKIDTIRIRLPHELSEIEANQRGNFRNEGNMNNHFSPSISSTDND